MKPAAFSGIGPIEQMLGDDEEETAMLRSMLEEARRYITTRQWCDSIVETYWGDGIGGVVAAFLFHVKMHESQKTRDEWTWVICGDVPTMYLDSDMVHTPIEAFRAYLELLGDWVAVAKTGGDLSQVIPIDARPDSEHIGMLEQRIELLRNDIIPALEDRGARPERG